MAFTKALYYPWIDIKNEGWLKNALFYWDSIQTIVPESMRSPYKNSTSKEFHDNGYLIPLKVNSQMQEINSLEEDVLSYINSKEGVNVLLTQTCNNDYKIYKEKLPDSIRMAELYPEKLSNHMRDTLGMHFREDSDKYYVDEKFANFYMSILSAKLAEQRNISLLTEINSYNNLANTVRFDNNINVVNPGERHHHFKRNFNDKYLKEGLMSELLLDRVNISPDTPVKNIINYKKRYKDELGRFRTKVGELSNCFKVDADYRAIRQHIDDLIINEIQPSINDLIKSLESNMIKFIVSGFLKVSLFSVSPASLIAFFISMALAPYALFAGAGISLTSQIMLYNREKQNILSKNPYSYLMTLADDFQE